MHPPYSGNRALRQFLVERILAHPQRRISFADYMDWVLYHPEQGYYASRPNQFGMQGDFVTSPYLASDFGELLAEQWVDVWQSLGGGPMTLLEMGAGQGLLARDSLRYLAKHHRACFEALSYRIVEKSPALRAVQRSQLAEFGAIAGKVAWTTWEAIAPGSLVGCCFSNELVDAFPVHQVVVHGGQLQEVYVTADENGSLIEVLGELSTPRLQAYFELNGIDLLAPGYPEGYRTEVNLAALDWLETVSDRLQRGYVVIIDYGYPASRYYAPARSQGTLQCYYQHQHHSDPYAHIGQQDLTAHVNFTALERQGDRCGLQTLGFTQQGLFLMALGLGDRLTALSAGGSAIATAEDISRIFQRREVLHSLMDPMGLGNFGVLVQSKGLSDDEQQRSLKGLQQPF